MVKNILDNTVFLNSDKKRIITFLQAYLDDKDLYNFICVNEKQAFDEKKYFEEFTKNIFSKYVDIKIKQMEKEEDYSLSDVRKYDLVSLMRNENKSDEEKRLSNELEYLYFDSAGMSSLGFHINDRFLYNGNMSWLKNEIKMYINSDSDIYKIARLFWDKCDAKKIKMYFKLTATPYENDGLSRTDKMCIYSSFNDLKNYINLLDEIKNENPSLTFLTPPISTAIYDGYIGLGCDLTREQLTNIKDICVPFSRSYNSVVSSIFDKVFSKFIKNNALSNKSKEEVLSFVNSEIGYSKLTEIINSYLTEIAKITDNEFFKCFLRQEPNNIKYYDAEQKDKNKNI